MTLPEPRSFRPEVMADAGFPTISYHELEVGTEFRSDDRLVRPQDVDAYAFMVDDYDQLYFEPGPFGAPIAHPTLLANQALFLRHTRYFVPAGLHARMVFAFHRPIRLGTRARTTGRVVDKYVRRNKPYMVTEYTTSDENGETLVNGRFVQMLFQSETAPPPSGTGPLPEREALPLDPAIRRMIGRTGPIDVGHALNGPTRVLSQRQIDAYSGVRPGSIHTDEDWARAKGFRTTIAQGMMSCAYVSALATDLLGAGFVAGGRLDVRFLRPVHRDDRLTASGTVTGFAADDEVETAIRVFADVEVRNQVGEQTLGGIASGLVDAEMFSG